MTNNTLEVVNYALEGNKIIREERTGENSYSISYFYDSNDNVTGFTYNGNKYLYLKNIQNDIVGIVDSDNDVVVKYYYDGYGNLIKTIDISGINLSKINPFRYRSYYQDNETGWYYLNSRYYDSLTRRFVTMDQIEYLGCSGNVLGYNLYAYCEGNPIMYVDNNGNVPSFIIITMIVVLSAVLGFCATVLAIDKYKKLKEKWSEDETPEKEYNYSTNDKIDDRPMGEATGDSGFTIGRGSDYYGDSYRSDINPFSEKGVFSSGSVSTVPGGYIAHYDNITITKYFFDMFFQ